MSDAQVKLDSMVVGDRVTAVAEDVQSRRDAYRSIKSWVLADLLGVPNPEHPDGSWNFKFIVARIPLIEEISNIDLEGFRVLVEACLPIERCDAIIEQIARFGPYSDLNDSDITFITPAERELIEFGKLLCINSSQI